MTTFDTTPLHDPETCTRVPCGRCKPPSPSRAPGIIPNPHNTQGPSKPTLPKSLDPDALVDELEPILRDFRKQGRDAGNLFADWTVRPRIPTFPEANDGHERSIEDQRNHLENAKAAAYWSEWLTLLPRLRDDARRLKALMKIAGEPNRIGSVSNVQGCELCADSGVKQDGKPVPFDHRSNVGERLPRDMFLCQAHYLYVQRHDHAPTREQTRHWSTTGTWKVKV